MSFDLLFSISLDDKKNYSTSEIDKMSVTIPDLPVYIMGSSIYELKKQLSRADKKFKPES